MVLRAGLEPTTLCLEGRCSIQLSYRSTYYATGFFEGYATTIPSHSSMSYTLGPVAHPVRARTPCFCPCPSPVAHPVRAEKRVFFSESRRQIIQKAVRYNIPPPNEKSTRMSAKILKQTADRGQCHLKGTSKNGFRRLFASGQSPTGKFFGGYLQAATLNSSCIGLLAHTLKNHPVEF